MIKALAALVEAAPGAAADGAAAAEAAGQMAGMASFALPTAAGLLQLCMDLPEQLPVQQRVLMHARSMVMAGQLIEHAFAAPAASPGIALPRLLTSSGREPSSSVLAGLVEKQLKQLIGMILKSIPIIDKGLLQVQLPGAAAAAAEQVTEQLLQQVHELFECAVKHIRRHLPELLPESSEEEEEGSEDGWTTDDGEDDEEYEGEEEDMEYEDEEQQEEELQQQQQQQQQRQQEGSSTCSGGASSSAAEAAAGATEHNAGAVNAVDMQTTVKQILSLELGQQLQQFGSAVVVQLPQPLWCCNPRWSS
jgi:hypothetical protein